MAGKLLSIEADRVLVAVDGSDPLGDTAEQVAFSPDAIGGLENLEPEPGDGSPADARDGGLIQ